MNNQKHGLLIQLGIPSFEEADELELELNLRFDDFTPSDVKVWQQQSAYLHHFAKTGSVIASAREAGVAVVIAQSWEARDVYGFNRRLEVSELEYCEGLDEMAFERATQPNAPVSLLIAILRARMPEKYGQKDRKPDKDKDEAMLYKYSVNARQEKADGYPVLQRIIQGDPDPFRSDPDREQPHAGTQDAGLDDDPPLDQDELAYSNLSTAGDDIPHPGLSPAGDDIPLSDLSPDGDDAPLSALSPDGDDAPHPSPSPAGDDIPLSDLSPAGGEIQRGGPPRHALAATGEEVSPQNRKNLNRAARRQLQRQQRKQEKKNVFPAKRF